MIACLRALSLSLPLLTALPAQAEIHALVIGIDDYVFVPSLAGAVNDARDLADALERRDARVTLLLDDEVTRDRVLSEFEAIAGRVQTGDTVVLTYAGHGMQLPEALAGDESDGKDETFILHGFETSGDGFSERLRDNDIAAMLRQIPEDVSVLVVADSCHSGTMTRNIDPRGKLGRSRFVEVGPITATDTLPLPASTTRAIDMADFPNVVFANAARDDQQTPEVEIDGRYRGALSWSIARAIEGAAEGGDGATSLGDFRTYVIEQVRALSGTRQQPGVGYSTRGVSSRWSGLTALFGGAQGGGATRAEPPVTLADMPTLFVTPADDAPPLLGMTLAPAEESARLLWDRGAEELVDRATADPIADARTEAEMRDAVTKWRAAAALARWAPKRPLEFRVEPDDRRYRIGEKINIVVRQPDPELSYLTIVNLASSGEVQFIYPAPGHVSGDRDRIDPVLGEARLGPAPVTAPTGADHVIALASRTRLDVLHRALDALHGARAPEALLELLEAHAADPQFVRVGVLPIFTER